ncbi:hypothetical protein B9Z19DRAFT_1070715 [Tuber borchii]|uniref:Uncharacterized protein n=1 Tax=Tuber borchii TaxID=42251 RepID=A0A2T7A8T4_TUBBO|nr:hypothetical protein B9Z19DRAFT_1070715 [Tuber borchii]
MGSPSRIVATLSMIFPSRFRQLPLPKRNRDVGYKTSPSKTYPSYLRGRLRIERHSGMICSALP